MRYCVVKKDSGSRLLLQTQCSIPYAAYSSFQPALDVNGKFGECCHKVHVQCEWQVFNFLQSNKLRAITAFGDPLLSREHKQNSVHETQRFQCFLSTFSLEKQWLYRSLYDPLECQVNYLKEVIKIFLIQLLMSCYVFCIYIYILNVYIYEGEF